MQVVEDMEKDLLRTGFPAKELHVVHDEHIHTLVEIDEVVAFVLPERIDVLLDKLFGRNVKYLHRRVGLHHGVSDGLRQMGFPQAHPAIDQDGVERRFSRPCRNRPCCTDGQLVGLPLHQIFKRIGGIELRGEAHRPIARIHPVFRVFFDIGQAVPQTGIVSQHRIQSLPQLLGIVLFDPLVEDPVGDLYGQRLPVHRQSPRRREPRRIFLLRNLPFDFRQTSAPKRGSCFPFHLLNVDKSGW